MVVDNVDIKNICILSKIYSGINGNDEILLQDIFLIAIIIRQFNNLQLPVTYGY